ncbi:MAG TPA: PAS domain S-box protein [Xanthomonadaceae bacterium]|nr:PAS domain S-box protein [Xanthomonadaceae bacterium]
MSALIAMLHAAGQRLEELTAGEVDTVADREGRTFALCSTQEHLRHSNAAKQAAILNALPAHIALLDARGVIVSVNATWQRFADANVVHCPGYAIGTNYLQICADARVAGASEAHQVADGIRSVLDGGARSFSIEYACHSPMQQRWFLLTVTPLAEGLPNGVVVMHIDVTAERKAEQSLRTSESRFRQMAENIVDVFFLVDIQSNRMLYISPAYEEIWGRSCESVYANPESWIEAVHPDDLAATYEKFKQGMSGGKSKFEYRVVRPDGSIRWIETRDFPIHDDRGTIVRIAGIAKDITVHKRAAQELRESERRFSDMLDNVDLVTVMLDRDARITYCNEYLLHLTGWRLDEVSGKNWFEVFMPVEVGDMKPKFAELLANAPAAWHVENELLTRSGERRLIRWNNSVLRSGIGEVIGTASIGEDITQRKAAEEVLIQHTAELERFHRLSVGRELQMVELKKQINESARQAGQAPPHNLAFLDPKPARPS